MGLDALVKTIQEHDALGNGDIIVGYDISDNRDETAVIVIELIGDKRLIRDMFVGAKAVEYLHKNAPHVFKSGLEFKFNVT